MCLLLMAAIATGCSFPIYACMAHIVQWVKVVDCVRPINTKMGAIQFFDNFGLNFYFKRSLILTIETRIECDCVI